MCSICGAKCDNCSLKSDCKGCGATDGSPFGGKCIAAEYIKTAGKDEYNVFKKGLLDEVNGLLENEGLPKADALYELCGQFVNLYYRIPNGNTVKFLDDKNIYLGTQIEFADKGVCYGVVADKDFILLCSYSVDGSEAELVLYKHR